jgi:hypothetical protein
MWTLTIIWYWKVQVTIHQIAQYLNLKQDLQKLPHFLKRVKPKGYVIILLIFIF